MAQENEHQFRTVGSSQLDQAASNRFLSCTTPSDRFRTTATAIIVDELFQMKP
jgi:hypothetical protein